MASVRKRTWLTSNGEPRERWVVAYQHKNRQHLKTFATKREAVAWRAQMQVEVKRGTHTPSSQSPTVAQAGQQWLDQATVDGLERATIEVYRQHYRHHIAPYLGPVKLAALEPSTIQDFSNRLVRDGRSAAPFLREASSVVDRAVLRRPGNGRACRVLPAGRDARPALHRNREGSLRAAPMNGRAAREDTP